MKFQLGRYVVETNHIQYALEESNSVILTFVSGDTLEVYCGIEAENLCNFHAATQLTPAELNRAILQPVSQQETLTSVRDLERMIPFSHQEKWWQVYSDWFKTQKGWICENCGLSLKEDRSYLDTHHIRGIQHNAPSDLKALCIGCHAEEETPIDHRFMKTDERYRAFMSTYGASKAKAYAKGYWDKFKVYVEEKDYRLQLFPKHDSYAFYGIEIDQKTCTSADIYNEGAVWLLAYRDSKKLQANLCMQSPIHYSYFRNMKGQLEGDLGELKWDDDNRRIGFHNEDVGNVTQADTDQEFSWLHDRLVRLHEIFQPLVLGLQEGT